MKMSNHLLCEAEYVLNKQGDFAILTKTPKTPETPISQNAVKGQSCLPACSGVKEQGGNTEEAVYKMESKNDSPESGSGKNNADIGRVYTTSEVAVYCQVSPNTVGRWFTEGRVPVFKTAGGRRRVWGKDLVSLMESLNIPVPQELRDYRPPRVLIVDDEEHARRAIKRWVMQDFPNVQVEEAVDGFDAGRKLAGLVPAVVILDIVLPGIDGLEVCRRIRSDEHLRSVRILAISGHDAETTKNKALDAGADAFQSKPLEMDVFISQLEELLPAAAAKRTGHIMGHD